MLSGEAGIGKTALLDDLRSRARDIRVLSMAGTEAERDLPFAGLSQLLRVTAADLETLPAPQAAALGVALALRPGGNVDRFAVGAGLLTLLAQRSEAEPVCLIVDDAHLLDQPSADALLFVARRLLADAIAFVIAVRDGEPCRLADPELPRLRLGGIDEAAARDLVRTARGASTADPHPGSRPCARWWRCRWGIRSPSWSSPRSGGAVDRAGRRPLGARHDGSAPADAAGLVAAGLRAPGPRARPGRAAAARCAAVAGDDLSVITRACRALSVPVSALAAAEDAGLLSWSPTGCGSVIR